MSEAAPNFYLRAVISEIDADYIVSISKVSHGNDIAIIGEEEVEPIKAAYDFIGRIARGHSYPPKDVDKLYNVGGKISKKPPKGRK